MKTQLRFLKTIFTLLFFYCQGFGQNQFKCGTDEALKSNPELQKILENFEKDYKQKKLNQINVIPDMTTVYTVPVVFHVYHLGEAIGTGSNVSDAAIQASVDRLNAVFRATGIHTGLTPDIKIQFVLASKTPNCDPTNGIVRIDGRSVSGYTNGVPFADYTMQQALRNLSTWSTDHYVNIRICHTITDTGGFAFYLNDLFMPANSVNTNTNQLELDNFWAHEMGHSMNLFHTFYGDGTPNGGGTGTIPVCPVNNDPENDGDKISDTDPHKNNDGCNYNAINSCTGNVFGNVLKNIMSYSCKETFTPKQMERMRYALINYRFNLINSKGITGITSPPLANSVTKCSSGSVILTASGCSGTYNWYAASSGGNSLGTGSSYTTPSLSSSTTYYVSCTEANCGTSNRTPAQVVITPSITVNACNVTATHGLSGYFGISNFSIGTITYTGSTSYYLGTNYQDNTCIKTDLQAGSSYPFTITGMYGNNMLGNIYIDYNNDGDFDDTNEMPFEGSWGITQTGNIIPPSTATTNTYLRMRVMLDGGSITSCLLDGHPIYGSGLSLDFAVKILPANCTTPTTPTTTSASRCGPGSVTLSASGCAGTYKWYSTNTETGTPLASTASYTTPFMNTTYTYYVDCTVGVCTSTRSSATATINANTTPVPTVSSTTINSGQTATLTATGCTGTVNWYNAPIGGSSFATGTSYTTPALSVTTTYYADCSVNNCTSTTRGSGTITVNQTTITLGTLASSNYCMGNYISVPFTTTLPAGTVCTATLKKGATIINTSTVTVGNISGFPYTTSLYIPWSQDVVYGTDYTIQITSGANSSVVSPSLTIGNIMSAYISDVNNNSIYTNPDYLCTGKTKVYYATVKDNWGNVITNGVSYQWQKDGVAIVGATTNSLNVTQSGVYSFVATQGACSRTANSITLQVGTINNQSTIVYGDAVACAGTSKRVESSYYSNTATYQWQKDGVTISGAVNRTYDATQSGLYKVITTDGTCINTSYEQRLTFGTGLLAPITASGNDTTLCGGNSKYLSASIYTINPTQYTYQWQKDGVNISGATSNNYSATQAGVYSVTYSQGTCTATSRGITIISSTLAQKPVITAGSITNICNGSIIINQNINGNYSYLYGTWYKDGVIVNSATNYQYVANTSGTYKMVNGSGSCANESNTVTVSIGSTFTPKIYIPTYYGKTNLCGTGDYLYIYFDNQNLSGGTYTYQWQKDGVNIAGETNQYLYVTTAGNYTLSVSNGSCSGISNGIIITNNTPVTYITASENNTSCTNKAIRLDLKGGNSYYFTPVVWKKDGVIISGETSSFLYTNQAGVYTATYNQNGCSGTSLPIYINTGTRQPAAIPPVFINSGQMGTLTVSGCTGTVNWYNTPTGGNSLGTGFSFTSPPLTLTTLYYADCSVNNCVSSFRASGAVSVNCLNMYSLKTGSWNDISVWSCGRLPNSSDIVTISIGNTVTIPSGQTGFLYNLIQKGILVNNGLLKFRN